MTVLERIIVRIYRRKPVAMRYVRKPKVAGRRVYAKPATGRHRAGLSRPSYLSARSRAARLMAGRATYLVRRADLTRHQVRSPRPATFMRRVRTSMTRTDGAPVRDIRAVGKALTLYVPRTVSPIVRRWLNHTGHPVHSHRRPQQHRRDAVWLPYGIGWCHPTDEHPTVTLRAMGVPA